VRVLTGVVAPGTVLLEPPPEDEGDDEDDEESLMTLESASSKGERYGYRPPSRTLENWAGLSYTSTPRTPPTDESKSASPASPPPSGKKP